MSVNVVHTFVNHNGLRIITVAYSVSNSFANGMVDILYYAILHTAILRLAYCIWHLLKPTVCQILVSRQSEYLQTATLVLGRKHLECILFLQKLIYKRVHKNHNYMLYDDMVKISSMISVYEKITWIYKDVMRILMWDLNPIPDLFYVL